MLCALCQLPYAFTRAWKFSYMPQHRRERSKKGRLYFYSWDEGSPTPPVINFILLWQIDSSYLDGRQQSNVVLDGLTKHKQIVVKLNNNKNISNTFYFITTLIFLYKRLQYWLSQPVPEPHILNTCHISLIGSSTSPTHSATCFPSVVHSV